MVSEIVLTQNEFHYQALVKGSGSFCFGDRVSLTELPESELTDETTWISGG
jgi:hypothetical protein